MLRRLLLFSLIATVLFLAWQWFTFPDVAGLANENPATTAFMERRKHELRRAGKDDTIEYRWVPYNRISQYLRRAVLVSEDNAFYEHEGVDVEGLKEALRRDWTQKRFTHGGSTITQQLAKNLYLSPSRNPFRKVKEYFIARTIEQKLTKKRILELYLNVVEFGERVYGAEAAAREYFGKPAAALTPREGALLAGSLPNPRVMNPADPNKRLRARQRIILSRMRRWGHLAETQVLTAKKEVLKETVPGAESRVPSPGSDVPESIAQQPVIDTSVPDEPSAETEPLAETPAEPPTEAPAKTAPSTDTTPPSPPPQTGT